MKYDLQSCIRRYNAGEMLEYVFFWGRHSKSGQVTKACFSQWYPCAFEVDGITYNCAEQYMMAEKARVFNDEEVLSKILVTSNPKDIKALGREVKNFDAMKWSSVSKDSSSLSNFALVSTASRLLPSRRLSLAFHNSGLHDSLQPNCAIVRFTVIRPIIGALPDLSVPLFFR